MWVYLNFDVHIDFIYSLGHSPLPLRDYTGKYTNSRKVKLLM